MFAAQVMSVRNKCSAGPLRSRGPEFPLYHSSRDLSSDFPQFFIKIIFPKTVDFTVGSCYNKVSNKLKEVLSMKSYEMMVEGILKVKAESVTEALFKIHKLIEEMGEDIFVEDWWEHDVDDEELFDGELYDKMIKDYEKSKYGD